MTGTKQNNQKVMCGRKFETTGYYKLVKDNHNSECFIPNQANRMLFKKNEIAPLTGSCNHIAVWEFIESFSIERRSVNNGL